MQCSINGNTYTYTYICIYMNRFGNKVAYNRNKNSQYVSLVLLSGIITRISFQL